MNPAPARRNRRTPRGGAFLPRLLSAACLVALAGCAGLGRRPAQPSAVVITKVNDVPARVVSNFFVVESRQDNGAMARFLIDTGSSVTLVSPSLSHDLGLKDKRTPARRRVRVRGAHGGEVELEAVTIRKLWLGDTRFERVPALVFDFTDLSNHLGMRIDGVMGFPMFRDVLLTLDYPHDRLELAPQVASPAPLGDDAGGRSTIAFNNEQNSPLIPIQMGNESFVVLLDSGSDGSLSLNTLGLHPRFASGPRAGTLVASLAGDRQQQVGRLGMNLLIGSQVVEKPIVDLTDQLSSLGGELLRHFTLVFDQLHNRVTFIRDEDGPVRMAPRRSTGLIFSRSPAYWRVIGIVPDTETEKESVQAGDLCVRINGEPVEKWDYERYAGLLRSAARVTYTFISGTREFDLEIPVFELVP